MSADRNIPLFRHLLALLVLLALDAHKMFRRLFGRAFLRATFVALSLGLFAMVVSSLIALRQITRSVESLIGDSMVGLETTIAMRSAVREIQLDLLRMQLRSGRRFPAAKVATFRAHLTGLLQTYRTGIFDPEDEDNAKRIEQRLEAFTAALRPIVENPSQDDASVIAADASARGMVEAVEIAYQFNRRRIHVSADEVSNAARVALQISKRLGWGFALFAVCSVFLYFVDRWIALPEGTID